MLVCYWSPQLTTDIYIQVTKLYFTNVYTLHYNMKEQEDEHEKSIKQLK